MSIRALLMRELIRQTAKRRLRHSDDVLALRRALEQKKHNAKPKQWAASIGSLPLGEVTAERVAAENAAAADSDDAALLYLHGGAWVVGAPEDFRPLTTRLAQLTGVPVYVPDYRLAPEYAFPTALNDCEAAYRCLLERGISPQRIALLGDSAGGNLMFALALRLKRLGLPQPAALVGLSPCTDLSGSGASFKRNVRRDALLPAERLSECISAYCPHRSLEEPEISPLFGDLADIAPTLLQVSDNEILLDDSTRMAERIRAAGGEVELDVWRGLWHVWQVFPQQVPEARQAIARIAEFIMARLACSEKVGE
ncbi:Acetyl esterase [Carnimonas sp. R-84981]|uniref:alpha/beta hydrolase n=1 Tax=Carnimonas bestiolae TaxID=3402172 RepID=UPI003EDC83C4